MYLLSLKRVTSFLTRIPSPPQLPEMVFHAFYNVKSLQNFSQIGCKTRELTYTISRKGTVNFITL